MEELINPFELGTPEVPGYKTTNAGTNSMKQPQELIKQFEEEFKDITHTGCPDKTLKCGTMANNVKAFVEKAYLQGAKDKEAEIKGAVEELRPKGKGEYHQSYNDGKRDLADDILETLK